MFTGIVEETGTIKSIQRSGDYARITVNCSTVLGKGNSDPFDRPTALGDSIAVNGICLTVTDMTENTFSADVMHETMNRTALGKLSTGSIVNLERAMSASGRFGGHIVSGHIDGTGTVESRQRDGNAVWFKIRIPSSMRPYIVEKGSITIDGISLTVAEVSSSLDNAWFKVSIIPHTLTVTALGQRNPGDPVNLETDIIGKYVESMLKFDKSSVSQEEEQSEKDKRLMSLLQNF